MESQIAVREMLIPMHRITEQAREDPCLPRDMTNLGEKEGASFEIMALNLALYQNGFYLCLFASREMRQGRLCCIKLCVKRECAGVIQSVQRKPHIHMYREECFLDPLD